METPNSKNGSVTAELVKPSFGEAFKFWLKLGFISFGGPAGQIAIMHRELVDRRQWIGEEKFLHALNFCMLLPGPEAQQLAAYNGWRLHGIKGGIAAGALFVLPSIFFLLALSFIYAKYGNVGPVAAVLNGFKPVVVAIVVEAIVKIGRRSLRSKTHIITAVAAFFLLHFLNVPFPLIVLGAAIFGFAWSRHSSSSAVVEQTNGVHWSRPLKMLAVFAGIWLAPFLSAIAVFGRESIAVKLYLFFTQAAFVTFGGAYAVLAYVNQAAVGSGWITAEQAVDGLALAETTPGPLIMVLQFIGFMTGWQNYGTFDQSFFAVVCAFLTTFATFLPSFLFIFALAPYVENLHSNKKLTGALSFVTAAVVGVILNLAIVFGSAVMFSEAGIDWLTLIVAAAAFAALSFLKLNVLPVVAAGGFIGLARFLLLG
ncbi:MAG TPA: chromate efflux transporter [Pyrinomonadaceae bacterium]|nr:chromate efflux transporter [Pyrinomonadaceae bacterium]HMP66756.1 chromate efflux transporter [Pyrinomonadaceae bacterium]